LTSWVLASLEHCAGDFAKRTRAAVPRSVPACAIWGATVWLAVALPGCLNPMPDENPSASNLEGVAPSPPVQRETCNDNPLLAGCSLPNQDSSSTSPGAPAPAIAAQGAGNEPAGPGGADAGSADAGTSADAGADDSP
jgi:hypothetical protein